MISRLLAWIGGGALFLFAFAAAADSSPEAAPAQAEEPPPSFHPMVTLRDADGMPVYESGKSLSALKSCDGCHEAAFINDAHSYHVSIGADERVALGKTPSRRPWDFSPGLFGRWDPMTYDVLSPPGSPDYAPALDKWIHSTGGRLVGGGPCKDVIEHDCLVCHAKDASAADRAHAIAEGKFDKARMATLSATGLANCECKGGGWNKDNFMPDGRIMVDSIGLGRPTDHACGGCHAMVHEAKTPFSFAGRSRLDRERQRMTETEGVVWSGQRVGASELSVASKDAFDRPWDVHAKAKVACIGCHFSPNNPAYTFVDKSKAPAHLLYDARHDPIGDYLRRPDHNLAKGFSSQGTVANKLDGQMRDCQDCHNALVLHKFLPQPEMHFSALRCESCHIPSTVAPARSETDWTMLPAPGEPRVTYRGIRGAIDDAKAVIEGFVPVLLPRTLPSGKTQLVPNNLVTTWYWVEAAAAGPRPVAKSTLERAFFVEGSHRPALLKLLDRNGDGKLDGDELVLDTEVKVAAARDLLVTAGAQQPHIEGEIQPYNLSHGIVSGRFVTRECAKCHARESHIAGNFVLSNHPPAGVLPTLVQDANLLISGRIERNSDGHLVLRATPTRLGIYVPGTGQFRIVDLLGLFLFVGAFLGSAGHGAVRIHLARKRKAARLANEEQKP